LPLWLEVIVVLLGFTIVFTEMAVAMVVVVVVDGSWKFGGSCE